MSLRETYPVRLVETRPLAADVLHFQLETPGAERFEFRPGQHVCLSVAFQDGAEDRYYSIASPPREDNRFELCVAITDDACGRALAALEPGAELRCWGPSGRFALRDPLRNSLFIGTGTGVAPLRSMILSVLEGSDRGARNLALLLGARSPERLLYREELERLAADLDHFEFWPTLTRANGDWAGRRGRVLMHLADALSDRHHETDVYLCGQPEMVAEVREQLLAAGLDEAALFYEEY
jgi:ferredoxin-NADP reductase